MDITKTTEQTSYVLSGTGTIAGLAFNEWLAFGSFCILLSTFGVNTYYRWKADKRDQKLQKLKRKFPELDI